MSPIVSIALAIAAVAGASATILISGSKAYEETAVPQAASGLAMIYEEAAYEYAKAEKTPLPGTDHQRIARTLEVFEDPTVNYIEAATRRLKRRGAFINATRELPPDPASMIFGPIISLDDPWGTPYQLVVNPDGTLTATSAGADKTPGTADDVTSAMARKRQKLPHPSDPGHAEALKPKEKKKS